MRANDIKVGKRISNSILSYMMERGVDDISLRITRVNKRITIIAEGETDIEPTDLKEFNILLKQKRTPSLEEYYSTLLGYSDNINDIDLLGSMLDEGYISYDGKLLTFYAMRNSEYWILQ